jgi:hypothetical protein
MVGAKVSGAVAGMLLRKSAARIGCATGEYCKIRALPIGSTVEYDYQF